MGRLKEAHEKVLSGVEAFKLNDTFGFPLDLTREIAAEAGFAVDEAAFHIEMTKQRERARAERLAKDISGWSADLFGELTAEPTQFDGYETLSEKAKVLALSDGEELVDAIATDEAGETKDGVLVVLLYLILRPPAEAADELASFSVLAGRLICHVVPPNQCL